MTLPKEDLSLIAQIDARLKHYNLIQPIDTTEGEFEYRKMLTESMMNITKGKIYKCYYQKGEDAYTIINDIGNMDKDWSVVCFEDKTYTHAEFLAQEQGKEPNPNVIKFYDKYFEKAKTIAPIETEQRYSVEIEVANTLTDDCVICISTTDCTKPLRKLKAQEIQQAIKQYLSTNKF
jgi:hypothetical protein